MGGKHRDDMKSILIDPPQNAPNTSAYHNQHRLNTHYTNQKAPHAHYTNTTNTAVYHHLPRCFDNKPQFSFPPFSFRKGTQKSALYLGFFNSNRILYKMVYDDTYMKFNTFFIRIVINN